MDPHALAVWEEGQKSKRKRRHGHTFALADADDWDILQAAAPESKRRKTSHPQRKAGVRKPRARAKSSAAAADGVSAADADADTVAADAAVQPLRLKCVAWRMTAIRRQTIALTLSPVARMLYKRLEFQAEAASTVHAAAAEPSHAASSKKPSSEQMPAEAEGQDGSSSDGSSSSSSTSRGSSSDSTSGGLPADAGRATRN